MTWEDRIVEEARTWIGTPFRHQARLKHVGCDCIGLVWKAAEKAGAFSPDPAAVQKYLDYGRHPNPRIMRQALLEFFTPIREEDAKAADVVWLKWREDLPMHLALVAFDRHGRRTIIHAIQDAGRVVEHGFTQEWVDRIDSWWRYPWLSSR